MSTVTSSINSEDIMDECENHVLMCLEKSRPHERKKMNETILYLSQKVII